MWNTPCDSRRLEEALYALNNLYSFVNIEVIGQSVLGQDLYHITIGEGARKVHMNASMHANEWITTNSLMLFLFHYCQRIDCDGEIENKKARELFKETTLSAFPMINPDGVNLVLHGVRSADMEREKVLFINEGSMEFHHWKANIRGIDLNNQFPANWEIEKKRKEAKRAAPRDYPGDVPLTEPEVRALYILTEKENFDSVLSLHTQGEEFYWGYMNKEPQISKKMADEFARVSNYKSVQMIDSHAGFKDWFIHEYRRPGFTIELGKGINPLPISHLPSIYDRCSKILVAQLAFDTKG